jgi:ribosomal protein S18 acetylase RimI-like enzyme
MKPEVRKLAGEDAAALRAFFAAMPAEDRTFFFQDVTDPSVADAWASDDRRLRRCVVDEAGQFLAFGALEPGVDWSSHVAEVVLVVAPQARRRGIGRALARHLLVEAVERGFKKVTVMLPVDNQGAVDMFQKLGFEPEALLRDHLRSPEDGTVRDSLILAHIVDDTWSTMLTGGFEEAVR